MKQTEEVTKYISKRIKEVGSIKNRFRDYMLENDKEGYVFIIREYMEFEDNRYESYVSDSELENFKADVYVEDDFQYDEDSHDVVKHFIRNYIDIEKANNFEELKAQVTDEKILEYLDDDVDLLQYKVIPKEDVKSWNKTHARPEYLLEELSYYFEDTFLFGRLMEGDVEEYLHEKHKNDALKYGSDFNIKISNIEGRPLEVLATIYFKEYKESGLSSAKFVGYDLTKRMIENGDIKVDYQVFVNA